LNQDSTLEIYAEIRSALYHKRDQTSAYYNGRQQERFPPPVDELNIGFAKESHV
jgi:hypothetical protein